MINKRIGNEVRRVKDEKETRERLLESAQKEFMEKGYMGASLRSICKNAGVTTGALYFFFEDKEDLFGALVRPVLEQLEKIMQNHYQAEAKAAGVGMAENQDMDNDREACEMVIHFMYTHYDAFVLLLMRSQGSAYADCVSEIADLTSRHYKKLAAFYAKQAEIEPLEDGVIHWVAHMHIDIFVYLLEHVKTEKEAMRYIPGILQYTTSGWWSMFEK